MHVHLSNRPYFPITNSSEDPLTLLFMDDTVRGHPLLNLYSSPAQKPHSQISFLVQFSRIYAGFSQSHELHLRTRIDSQLWSKSRLGLQYGRRVAALFMIIMFHSTCRLSPAQSSGLSIVAPSLASVYALNSGSGYSKLCRSLWPPNH